MKSFFLTVLSSLILCSLYASGPILTRDARSIALGGMVASISSYTNPSALSLDPQTEINLTYENRFCMKELSTYTIAYSQPTKWIDVSALLTHYGYADYHETTCGLNVSKLLGNGFSLGVRLVYYTMNYIDNEDAIHVFTADAGIQYQPVENLLIGAVIGNPIAASYRHSGTKTELPIRFSLGVRYQIVKECTVWMEGDKSNQNPFCWKMGVEYELIDQMHLQAGVMSSPWMPTFGMRYRIGRVAMNAAGVWHSVLGISPALGLSFFF